MDRMTGKEFAVQAEIPLIPEKGIFPGRLDYVPLLPEIREARNLAIVSLSGGLGDNIGVQIVHTSLGGIVVAPGISELRKYYATNTLPDGLIIEVPLLDSTMEAFGGLREFLVGKMSKGAKRVVWMVETNCEKPRSEIISEKKKLMGHLGFVKPELIQVAQIKGKIVYWGGLQRFGQKGDWPISSPEKRQVICGDCGRGMIRGKDGICRCPSCSFR